MRGYEGQVEYLRFYPIGKSSGIGSNRDDGIIVIIIIIISKVYGAFILLGTLVNKRIFAEPVRVPSTALCWCCNSVQNGQKSLLSLGLHSCEERRTDAETGLVIP